MGFVAKNRLFLLPIIIILLVSSLAFGADPTPTPTPTPAGEKCLRAGDLCLPETEVGINSILGAASIAAGDWEKVAGAATTTDWWESASYKLLDDYGITKEQFDKANAAEGIKPQSLLLMVVPFVLIFFLLFCILDVKNPLTIFREGSAEWGFMESVKERIAPGWPLTELLETEYRKGFHKRIIAGLDTPMYGRILGELGKKSVAGMSSEEASGAMKSLGVINGKLKEQAKNVIRGILMDVATMLAAAAYVIPMMVVFGIAYFALNTVLPWFDAVKGWVPLLTIVYELLAITFWAFWLWEILKFMLIRSGFLFAMVFPISVLKFFYIPFTGGGIRIVARAFQAMGMLMVIAAIQPAAKTDTRGLVLGMTASMTLYILLVLLVLANGMIVSLVAESVAAPFSAVVGFIRGLSAAAVTKPAAAQMAMPAMQAPTMTMPQPGPLDSMKSLDAIDKYSRSVEIQQRRDGTLRAYDCQKGTELGLFKTVDEAASWAEGVGIKIGDWFGPKKKGQ